MQHQGIKRAIVYSLKPHQLHLCGLSNQVNSVQLLRDYLLGKNEEKSAREILNNFKVALAYYQVIANVLGLNDCYDNRVMEIYWLGNPDFVIDKQELKKAIKVIIHHDFPQLREKEVEELITKAPSDTILHHSFHVLFSLQLEQKKDKFLKQQLNNCLILAGKVVEIRNLNHITVECQPVIIVNNLYQIGFIKKTKVDWDKDLIPKLKIGQFVSLHFGTAIEILTEKQVENLRLCIQKNLDAFNARK